MSKNFLDCHSESCIGKLWILIMLSKMWLMEWIFLRLNRGNLEHINAVKEEIDTEKDLVIVAADIVAFPYRNSFDLLLNTFLSLSGVPVRGTEDDCELQRLPRRNFQSVTIYIAYKRRFVRMPWCLIHSQIDCLVQQTSYWKSLLSATWRVLQHWRGRMTNHSVSKRN